MKTIKYNIILLLMISMATFPHCISKKNDESIHRSKSFTETSEKKSYEENNFVGEESGEKENHEVLPEDIVELDADQIKLAGVQLGSVELRKVSGIIEANGIVTTAPTNIATVSVPLGGFVKSTNLVPGVAVKKGQTLAIIENAEYVDLQQNYLDIKSKLSFVEAEFKRHTQLYNDKVYSEKSLQQISSEYYSLKAQLKGSEQKLLLIGVNPAKLSEETITAAIALISPINGYVKTVNINIGKFVSPSDVLFEIINTESLLLELSLFEKDVNTVSIGHFVHFTVNNETHEHKAKIYQVGKSINSDRTYRVYAIIQESCNNVLPGMYVAARIEKSNKLVTAVPNEAVVLFDNKYYIFAYEKEKMEGGKPFTEFRFVEVTKGDTDKGFTSIQLPSGFDIQNTKIVIKGAYKVLSAKKNAGEMSCS